MGSPFQQSYTLVLRGSTLHLFLQHSNNGPLLRLLPKAEPPKRCIAIRPRICSCLASAQRPRPHQHRLQEDNAGKPGGQECAGRQACSGSEHGLCCVSVQ